MRYGILILAAALALASCTGKKTGTDDKSEGATTVSPDALTWNGYTLMEPTEIDRNIIDLIHQDWMLITSGDEDSYNTMTASWGAMGVIWQRPVSIITVRNTRYTFEFLQENDIYTLSFFVDDYKEALSHLGTKSGRDGDKVRESGLTPMATPEGSMSFEEASMIIECRKIYENELDPRSIFEDTIAADYIRTPGERHHMFIGEILSVWKK